MKKIADRIGLRTVLTISFLALGLALVLSQNNICVGALTCQEAMEDYDQKNMQYINAFDLHYHDSPTTCADQCIQYSSIPAQYNQCIVNCRNDREAAFGQAEIDLFGASGATCTPYSIDECAAARAMADSCTLWYPYYEYPPGEEQDAIFTQYYACRTASKIDNCQ